MSLPPVMLRIFCFVVLFAPTVTVAEIAGFTFESDSQEQRFKELSLVLRCLVCQNQSLADSNSGLANDLRKELYLQIIKNHSKQEILDFMTKRYGDFILYKPRFTASTLMLWLSPLLLVSIGVYWLIKFVEAHKPDHETIKP